VTAAESVLVLHFCGIFARLASLCSADPEHPGQQSWTVAGIETWLGGVLAGLLPQKPAQGPVRGRRAAGQGFGGLGRTEHPDR
jgi:hypothetical protein